ncbi:hypothetical protein ACEUZ9_004043 [Paracoccus litorisediminis]|uniref:hypothetical protein n=1 Tax=Paracoccus litorisediminis TaxID=2006130 RepID=UPI00373491B5
MEGSFMRGLGRVMVIVAALLGPVFYLDQLITGQGAASTLIFMAKLAVLCAMTYGLARLAGALTLSWHRKRRASRQRSMR